MEWQHIYPVNDLVEHTTDWCGEGEFACICNPTIDYENYIVIHDAMDGRIIFEDE